MKLQRDFYFEPDVVRIARELIGKVLFTRYQGIISGGVITETEAYNGIMDNASHAYKGRRTSRNNVMYNEGGVAYIYLCYGIHSLFNVVTNRRDVPHAVLIRGMYPLIGIDVILKRRGRHMFNRQDYSGPGNVSAALGIHYSESGEDLSGNKIWIEDRQIAIEQDRVRVTPRIGVDYAGIDALLPYRFLYEGNF